MASHHIYIYISDNSCPLVRVGYLTDELHSRASPDSEESALTTPMSGLPLPPPTIANHHQQLLCEVRESTGNIQSLDPMTRTLTVLPWYVVRNRDGHLIVGRRANSLYVAS
jgi:hypothetical protein